MNSVTPLLELRHVTVIYDHRPVISNFSMIVERGEFVLMHGDTGSGKSTILRLLSGLTQPTHGEVYVAGDRVDLFRAEERRWLRRSMGMMLQDSLLLSDRSVLDNVMLPAIVAEESFNEARRRAKLALGKCGIDHLSANFPHQLSAGQRQLTRLARAVVNRPAVILVDEPIVHLDRNNAETLLALLGAFVTAGVTVLCASHDRIAPRNIPVHEIQLSSTELE